MNSLDIENQYENIEDNFKKLGNSILYIVENKKIIGLIGVKDIVRKNTKKVIANLKDMKINTYILSGDNIETANIIADSLNIERENVKANLLPKEKLEHLTNSNENDVIMMVGDGINDALALSKASIGVSMGSSTDISKNSSDIILINNNLERIIDLITISKKTIRIIKENLIFSFFYNIIMITIALGIFKKIGISINPIIASISMTLSSLTVVFNSLRLKNKYNKL